MTKYILSSGGIKSNKENLKNFVKDIFEDSYQNNIKNPKFLICVFAEDRESWEKKLLKFGELVQDNLDQISKEENSLKIKPEFSLATVENFENEVKNTDIVYVYGGDIDVLKWRFSKFDIKKLFENKVVAGSSSGCVIFVKTFWGADSRKVGNGLGIINIKTIAHQGEDITCPIRGKVNWGLAKKELTEAEPKDMKITEIKTGEYKVFRI